MWHTLQDAIELTGRSRRSLYRDMDAGRVSYRARPDGRRELETAELIRAYGALKPVAQSTAQPVAQVGTAPSVPVPDHLEPLLEELRLLREEVRELRQALMLLEHKPAPADSSPGGNGTVPEPVRNQPPAKTFADLLAGLDPGPTYDAQ